MSRIVVNTPPSSPLYITDSPEQKWSASLAVNPVNKKAYIVNSTLSFSAGGQAKAAALDSIASTQAIAATTVIQLGGATNVVESNIIGAGADPALDPLQASSQTPAPGKPVLRGSDCSQCWARHSVCFVGKPLSGNYNRRHIVED